MKSFSSLLCLLIAAIGALLTFGANAEPVQYCKFANNAAEDINFCMGLLMFYNATSNAHDMFMTMTFRRHQGSALGWTAIGTGSIMKGSLMFIVYGDPLSGEDPIVSIRTATGHHQPTLLKKSDLPNGMDLRVIRSSWLQDDNEKDTADAIFSVVCYSCHLWQGTEISAHSKSQPWIWAWNNKQDFDVFSFDAHLLMHKHHAGAGGWGNFYLDMSRSINTAQFPPSLPPIRPGVATLGSADHPMSFSASIKNLFVGPGSFFHGMVLAIAFLLLFPAGVVGIRAGFAKGYTYHWVVQATASTLLILGLVLGLLKNRKLNSVHQWVGISLASSIGLQGLLGYWHHIRFVRLRRRTWVSYVHIWLGRLIMVSGWCNIVSGLLLRGHKKNSSIVIFAAATALLQALALSVWVIWVQRKRSNNTSKPTWARAPVDEDTFTLYDSDGGEEGDRESGETLEKETDMSDERARLRG
jgi:hypothetical protein